MNELEFKKKNNNFNKNKNEILDKNIIKMFDKTKISFFDKLKFTFLRKKKSKIKKKNIFQPKTNLNNFQNNSNKNKNEKLLFLNYYQISHVHIIFHNTINRNLHTKKAKLNFLKMMKDVSV